MNNDEWRSHLAGRHPGNPDTAAFPATWEGGHALIVEFGDEEITARCQCGHPFGGGDPSVNLDSFSLPWERHVMALPR